MRKVWSVALIPAFGLLAACDSDAMRVPYTGSPTPQAATTTAVPPAVVASPPASATVVTVPSPATPPATIVTTTPPPTIVTTAPQPPVVYTTPTVRTETVTLCGNGLVYSPRLGYCVTP